MGRMKLTPAQALAMALLRQHGLLPKWPFHFDHPKVRFGNCNYNKRQISLSRHLVALNPEEQVRDTILHEIAHALAPRGAGHGPAWRTIAISIGCKAQRCYGLEVARPTPRYRGKCPTCGKEVRRQRRAVLACGNCSRVYDARHRLIWSEATLDDIRGRG
jgi:predicted SprT family Zn-dependent metalloprotease